MTIKSNRRILFAAILLCILHIRLFSQTMTDEERINLREQIEINFKGDSQIEVGGPYAGVEFHHSSPLPQRISFYYPVANSIDNSTDYWHRDTTHVMRFKIKVNDGVYSELGLRPWEYKLTPYRVDFSKNDSLTAINISYEFCNSSSAFIVKYSIKNTSNLQNKYSFQTSLSNSLRTCHSYKIKKATTTIYDEKTYSFMSAFDDVETQHAQIFILNTGEKPIGAGEYLNNPDKSDLMQFYKKVLKPGEQLEIKQVIGSTAAEEYDSLISYLTNHVEDEIKQYEINLLKNCFGKTGFVTQDADLDQTYRWAEAVIYSNRHYLDGHILPMPCPAEYNFFFTHDMLVTNLANVFHDLKSVKNDLLFLLKHKNLDNIIPHAYYWKDSNYVTEYSGLDNWNHLWFLQLCGTYLRHSNDLELLGKLYPLIMKSVEITLDNQKEDGLMWAARPDGWDIGNSYGPRTFMTTLAIKGLREYIFISTRLGKNLEELFYYENICGKMQSQLVNKLWSDEQNYLINFYEDGSIDRHYYIGSLLAAHFNLLDKEKVSRIAVAAKQNLLDEKIGIYNVFPMDFHLLKEFLKFQDNEVGDPFLYANGGVWQHGNAWYTLNLVADGRKNEAVEFIKKVMTLKGIINSPNGQPAMYEYRCSNYNDELKYGKIDKPQFLWAAGWYKYVLYNIYAIKENEWNISFSPYLNQNQNNIAFDLTLNGQLTKVNITGEGRFVTRILFDKEELPTLVIPEGITGVKNINIMMGKVNSPYLAESNSTLKSCTIHSDSMRIIFKAFAGHDSYAIIIAKKAPKSISVDGKELGKTVKVSKNQVAFEIEIPFIHEYEASEIIITF
ncbi:MAG: hypothetical protein KKD86_00015 [Bacteroidetes bacterium]|nr:hypothetical protein [Bacteroidota bacterium]